MMVDDTFIEVTLDTARYWCAQYMPLRDRIDELWAGRRGLTALQIARLRILPADSLWLLLRRDVIPERTLRLILVAFAQRMLLHFERVHPECPQVRCVLETSEEFARGRSCRRSLVAAGRAAQELQLPARDAAILIPGAASRVAWHPDNKDPDGHFCRNAAYAIAFAVEWAKIETQDDTHAAQLAVVRGVLDGSIDTELPTKEWVVIE